MRTNDQRTLLPGRFQRDLNATCEVTFRLPAFLICALEARVAEANTSGEPCTLNDYVETELVNLVSLRDVAELDAHLPGFASAVQRWIEALRVG
jgi:hypothetical protein